VAFSVSDEKTYARGMGAFKDIQDHYPKCLLTLDYDTFNVDGIQKLNVIDWLMNS
jgi:hypothetical protein